MKKLLISLLAGLLAGSCNKEQKKIELLFENGGVWYLQEYTVNGTDSLKNMMQGAKLQSYPLEYHFMKSKDQRSNMIMKGKIDEIYFNYDKPLTSLTFINTGCYRSCECAPSEGNNCRFMPFMVRGSRDPWQIVTFEKDELRLEYRGKHTYQFMFNKSKASTKN